MTSRLQNMLKNHQVLKREYDELKAALDILDYADESNTIPWENSTTIFLYTDSNNPVKRVEGNVLAKHVDFTGFRDDIFDAVCRLADILEKQEEAIDVCTKIVNSLGD